MEGNLLLKGKPFEKGASFSNPPTGAKWTGGGPKVGSGEHWGTGQAISDGDRWVTGMERAFKTDGGHGT